MNIDEIIENYSNMATVQLIELVNEIDQLREDVIPYLRAELVKRGEDESAEKIDELIMVHTEDVSVNFVEPTDREVIKFIMKSRSENKNEIEISIALADIYSLDSDGIKKIKTKVKKKGQILRVLAIVFLALFIYRAFYIYTIIDSFSGRKAEGTSLMISFIRLLLNVILASKFYVSSTLMLRNSDEIK